jgi:hypothetical protein
MSRDLPIYSIVVPNAVSVFGRILPGFLADKLGRFNICTVMSAVLTLTVWLPGNSNTALPCYSAFFSFFSVYYISLTEALAVEVSPPTDIGHRTGILSRGGKKT